MNARLLNADLGERGIRNAEDLALLPLLDVANIAVGGHAGDAASASDFASEAAAKGVTVSAHISYPDRDHFGRVHMDLPAPDLLEALDAQRACLPESRWLKFHGALYNDAARDEQLAEILGDWARRRNFTHLLTLPDSALEHAAHRNGLQVVREFFAERRYTRAPSGQILLLPRSHPDSSIHRFEDAVHQCQIWLDQGLVNLIDADPPRLVPLEAETLCIHSDSPIAFALAQHLHALLHS